MNKKIAIMQPYFMPYLGYFSLIKHTDEFVLFDTPQFIRHGWIERNRILKQDSGWLYIKVPLIKSSRTTAIKDVFIDNNQNWKDKIRAQLQVYKKTAPYYQEVMALMDELFADTYVTITDLNIKSLKSICKYLNINKHITIFSEMELNIAPPNAPDEWALNISVALGDIDEYWNPPGGREFFNKQKYDEAGIKLVFQKPVLGEYDQKHQLFESGLSIIDVMMFNSPEEVNLMLDKYEIE